MRVFLIVVALVTLGIAAAAMQVNNGPTASSMLSGFDDASPGHGWDSYLSADTDHAMTYAVYASAASISGDVVRATIGVEWLANNASPAPGVTGWGLPFAWDAFSDGSINPVDTVYGITTALAVRALVDVYEAQQNVSYLALAHKALSYYASFYTKTESGGFFWYSDQPKDAKDVANVNSMLIGQYARVGVLAEDAGMVKLALNSAKHLLAHRKTSELGAYWTYGTEGPRPNDMVHAAYTVQGLLDLSAATGRPLADLDEEVRYLQNFVHDDAAFEFAPHSDIQKSLALRPARLWGIGTLIYALTDAGKVQEARRLLNLLEPYKTKHGAYASVVGGDDVEPRMTSHLAWGLAKLESSGKHP